MEETPKTTPRRPEGPPPAPWYLRMWATMQRGGSAGWFLSTMLQAALTWGFIGLARLSEGWPWERQAKLLVIVAIVATWGMALRAIRARLLELVRSWHKNLVMKAGGTRLKALPRTLLENHEKFVKGSMLRLRIIAAGITMPFFVLPLFTAALCLALTCTRHTFDFVEMACLSSVMAAVVAIYFRWSILASPAPAAVRPAVRRPRARRERFEA
ncbi:MAG: hypothetical protein KIS92_13700 [Planctomycetota bacterium]|nr:hypothetical protein [Planctomycetota bacterium]